MLSVFSVVLSHQEPSQLFEYSEQKPGNRSPVLVGREGLSYIGKLFSKP